jgi:hypothetical protein
MWAPGGAGCRPAGKGAVERGSRCVVRLGGPCSAPGGWRRRTPSRWGALMGTTPNSDGAGPQRLVGGWMFCPREGVAVHVSRQMGLVDPQSNSSSRTSVRLVEPPPAKTAACSSPFSTPWKNGAVVVPLTPPPMAPSSVLPSALGVLGRAVLAPQWGNEGRCRRRCAAAVVVLRRGGWDGEEGGP